MKLNRLKIEYNLHILPSETGRETLNVCLHQCNVWVHCRPGQLVYSGHEYTFWGDTSKPYQVTVIVFVTSVILEIKLLLLMAMVVVIRTRMMTVSPWPNQEFKQHMEDRQTFVREAGHQYSVWKPIQKLISLQQFNAAVVLFLISGGLLDGWDRNREQRQRLGQDYPLSTGGSLS